MRRSTTCPRSSATCSHTTPVTVSNRGHEFRAYGHYIGGTVARDVYPDHIVVYQDTLERDFGHGPACCGRRWSGRSATSSPTTSAGTSTASGTSGSDLGPGLRRRRSAPGYCGVAR